VVIALTYMRRNRVQAELAETFGVSRSTISRAVSAITPLLGTALADHVPAADDLDENSQYIIDGILLPCWSWASDPNQEARSPQAPGLGEGIQQAGQQDSLRHSYASDPSASVGFSPGALKTVIPGAAYSVCSATGMPSWTGITPLIWRVLEPSRSVMITRTSAS
jgi:hypothetical protein